MPFCLGPPICMSSLSHINNAPHRSQRRKEGEKREKGRTSPHQPIHGCLTLLEVGMPEKVGAEARIVAW